MTDKPGLLAIAAFPAALAKAVEGEFRLHRAAPDLSDAADVPLDDIVAVVTSGSEGLSNQAMDALPRLQLIAVNGVGYDQIDLAHARSRGVRVTNTPDVLSDDVADLAIGLSLAVFRRIAASDRFVREGRWAAGDKPPLARRLSGARVGILGLGRIGRLIARRMEGFTDQIRYHNRSAADAPYPYVESGVELARWADLLIVAAPGGPQTQGLVSAEVIEALGPAGVLVNVARGSVVDEAALVAALVAGRLGGAGLDVFDDEPNAPRALWTLDNVVLQPHLGSATVETRTAMGDLVVRNLKAWRAGEPLISEVK